MDGEPGTLDDPVRIADIKRVRCLRRSIDANRNECRISGRELPVENNPISVNSNTMGVLLQ